MDEWLLYFFNQTLARPWLDVVMAVVSVVGLAVCPAVGVVLWARPIPPAPPSAPLRVQAFPRREGGESQRAEGSSRRRGGAALLAALLVGLVLVLAFQYSVLRPRPDAVRLVWAAPNFPSFPSGHAMAGFATATVLALAAQRRRGPVAGLAYAGAALLALSRVYLGHHYPSDVFAGAVLGAGVGAAAYGLLVERAPGAARWRWLLWVQVALIVVVSQAAYMGRLPLAVLTLPFTDKVLHFLMFGSVTFWLSLWWRGAARAPRLGSVPAAVAVPFGLAVLEEGAQAFSSWRSAGVDDLAADLAGMIVFWLLSQRLTGKKP